MREDQFNRFLEIREILFSGIAMELKMDGHSKSYEGAFSLRFPNYFEDRDRARKAYGIELSCYVLGPGRHHEWYGDSWEAVLDQCEKDVREWVEDSREEMEARKSHTCNQPTFDWSKDWCPECNGPKPHPKDCKCGGEGWLWRHELYEVDCNDMPIFDDTKYRCDAYDSVY